MKKVYNSPYADLIRLTATDVMTSSVFTLELETDNLDADDDKGSTSTLFGSSN